MNASRFLRADGTLDVPQAGHWSGWLPDWTQVLAALRLEFDPPEPGRAFGADAATAPEQAAAPEVTVWDISMRQALGLVVVAGLLAGVIPFVVNWVSSVQAGGVLPLVQLARAAEAQDLVPLAPLWSALQDLGGLQPAVFPVWLAAFLAALGGWINQPLNWLTWWIVYGAAVLLTAKIWGAPATLQQFYALTGYAAVPLVLTGLGPIPFLGPVANFVAVVWMLVVYGRAVSAVTGLSFGRTLLAVLLPGAVLGLLATLAVLSLGVTLLRVLL
jgi:hypothetical protein